MMAAVLMKTLMNVELPGMNPKNGCQMKPKGCGLMREYFSEVECSLHFAKVPIEAVGQEESIRAAPWFVCPDLQVQLFWFLFEEQ